MARVIIAESGTKLGTKFSTRRVKLHLPRPDDVWVTEAGRDKLSDTAHGSHMLLANADLEAFKWMAATFTSGHR